MKSEIHWFSVWQFTLSSLAIFALWSIALVLAILGLVEAFSPPAAANETLSLFLMAGGLAASGLLLAPSAVFALLRLTGREVRLPDAPGRLRPSRLIFTLPLVLLVGYWVSEQIDLAWLLLPPLHVLAIGLPVLWLLYLGTRGLPSGSPQRRWGVFGSGLVLGPALILAAELVALLAIVMVSAILIASQPAMAEEINSLLQQLMQTGATPEEVIQTFRPYLLQPLVLFGIFSFAAVIVPMIEELLKPVGVWLLAGRDLSPAAGFVAGVLSGAGYALFESLALSSSGESWAFLVTARIGTAVIHILLTGMVGWALALAWRGGRYLRLAAAYLAAVLVHGAWNGMTLLTIFPSLMAVEEVQPELAFLYQLGSVAPVGLGVLAVGGFALLLWANRRLRHADRVL